MSRIVVVALGAAALLSAPYGQAAAAPASCSWSPQPFTSVTEGDAGTVTAALDLVCANPTGSPISIRLRTLDGTAVAPGDYDARDEELEVPAGDSSRLVEVVVRGDTRPEATELVGLVLSGPTSEIDLPASGLVNIMDDDGFAVTSVSRDAPEGDTGSTTVDVEVRLSDPLEHPLAVTLYTLDGTATAGSDYAFSNQTQTFQPGELVRTYPLEVLGDTEDEPDETVVLGLSTQVPTLRSGFLTIVDDDAPGPCVLLSETEVAVSGQMSTPARRSVTSSPRFAVENCGEAAVELDVRGTDATGAAGTWALTGAASGDSTCDVGLDFFRAAVTVWAADGTGVGTGLTAADRRLVGLDGLTPFSLAPAATHEFSADIELPCEGSVGVGEPMTTQITLTAVQP